MHYNRINNNSTDYVEIYKRDKIKIMDYIYLSDIVKQIEKCKFTNENGNPIENNKAFIALKEHSICDGMSNKHDCKCNSNNYLCEDCLERVYQTPQG